MGFRNEAEHGREDPDTISLHSKYAADAGPPGVRSSSEC